MFALRCMVVSALAFTFLGGVASAGKGKKGQKNHNAIRGVVLEVSKDSFKIKVHQGKNGADNPDQAAEKTIQVNQDTQYFKMSGSKGKKEKQAATFDDVQTGAHLLIVPAGQGNLASSVTIVPKGKKNKE
jgi:ribosomal protein L15